MKTIGIIGGLGPETTANFYLEVVQLCFERNKMQRPPIIIWNVPLAFKTEERIITKAVEEEALVPYLVDAAQHLEKGGADFIVIPCNTAHLFIDEVRKAVKVPVLSIVEESVKFLKKKKVDKIGILSTPATVRNHLYSLEMENNSIELVIPNEDQIKIIGSIIHRLVTSNYNEEDKETLMKIISKLKLRNVEYILLACTDLQLIIPKNDSSRIFDTMSILAQASVDMLLID